MRWIRRHPIFTFLALFVSFSILFVFVDSGFLSSKIPDRTKGTQLLPQDVPYALYIPALTDEVVKTLQASGNFAKRDFTKRAGESFRQEVLLAPGIETSVDPHVFAVTEALMYLCDSEIVSGSIPAPEMPPGQLSFLTCGKLRLGATPVAAAKMIISRLIPELSWSKEGTLHVAKANGVPAVWLWIGSGWCVMGDRRDVVLAALERGATKSKSLTDNTDFRTVYEQQHIPRGFVFFTDMKSANAFLKSTGKPGNVLFATETERFADAVTAASWGYYLDTKRGIGYDLNIYPIKQEQMARIQGRYPRIDLQTAVITNEQTAFYAPFSLPLGTIETGDLVEMPKLASAAQGWLASFAHTSGRPIFHGEAAFVIDLIDDGPGVFAFAVSVKDHEAVGSRLAEWSHSGNLLPPNVQRVSPIKGGIELVTTDGPVQMGLRENLLLITTGGEAFAHFVSKKKGQSILERPDLKPRVDTALESQGTLACGVVYDSRMIVMNWQKRAEPHWPAFARIMESINIPVEQKPDFLKPEQVLSGGGFFVFLNKTGIEARHNMDKSVFGLVVPISTVPLACNLFYGKPYKEVRYRFYDKAESRDGFLRYLVEYFLNSDSVFVPTFAAHVGTMYYSAFPALAYVALNPADPE